MEVRVATPDEVNECEMVLRSAFGDYVRRLGREQSIDAYSWLSDAVADARVLASINLSTVNGVAIFGDRSNTRTIEQVAVKPGNQGRGIGSALIQRIESDAIERGLEAVELDTAEIMEDLLRLYHRHGFQIVRKGLPKHGRDDFTRVFMRKVI